MNSLLSLFRSRAVLQPMSFRAWALLKAAIIGPALLGGQLAFAGVAYDVATGSTSSIPLTVMVAVLTSIFSIPAFLAGTLLIGLPAWWLVHRLGLASFGCAIVVGGLCAAAGGAILLGANPDSAPIWTLTLLILPGAASGAVVYAAAYTFRPPPAPPA